MINTKETCELVSDNQIRDYIVDYLIKYNSKDFIDFISANPNRRKVFIGFDYNPDLKRSMFLFQAIGTHGTFYYPAGKHGITVSYSKIKNDPVENIKDIFVQYTQKLKAEDLIDIYDEILNDSISENIALANKLRHWLFSHIINPAYERAFYLKTDIYLKEKYRDEISCYLLQANDADWQNMSDDIFIELVKYYYNSHDNSHDNSLLTSTVIKKLTEKGESLIKRGAFIYTKDFLKLFSKTKYSVKPLILEFPNTRSDYSIGTIADICQNKQIILTLKKNGEESCFEDLCDVLNWYSLDKACSTGNCHFKKEDFEYLVSALPELKRVKLDFSVMHSVCDSLELITKYSI